MNFKKIARLVNFFCAIVNFSAYGDYFCIFAAEKRIWKTSSIL